MFLVNICLNCTFMELKEVKSGIVVKTHVSLNCTFMELKVI